MPLIGNSHYDREFLKSLGIDYDHLYIKEPPSQAAPIDVFTSFLASEDQIDQWGEWVDNIRLEEADLEGYAEVYVETDLVRDMLVPLVRQAQDNLRRERFKRG